MRILLVHNTYQQFGGEDTTFLNEQAQLRQAGHEVTTLVFSNADAAGLAGKLGLAWRSIYNPASARAVRQAILAHQPDVMHVHNFFYVASPAIFWAAKRLGVPVLVTVQNYRLICAGAYLLRQGAICEVCVASTLPLAGIRHACHRGSHVQSAQLTLNTAINKWLGSYRNTVARFITVTEFNRQKLIQSSLQLADGQVVAKPNAVADAGFVPAAQRKGNYLFVGRLSTEKGIATLLAAATQAGFGLDICGGGPLQGAVEAAAAAAPNIVYHGFQTREQVLARMQAARALLFTSVWYEGLPLTILEGFSTGLPVLISNLGNLNEIVTDGQDGLHFAAGNAAALAAAIATFEVADRHALGLGARATYERRYTPATNLAALEQIYTDVIADGKTGR